MGVFSEVIQSEENTTTAINHALMSKVATPTAKNAQQPLVNDTANNNNNDAIHPIGETFDAKTSELEARYEQLLNKLSQLESQSRILSSQEGSYALYPSSMDLDFDAENDEDENDHKTAAAAQPMVKKADEGTLLRLKIEGTYRQLQELRQLIDLRTYSKRAFEQYFLLEPNGLIDLQVMRDKNVVLSTEMANSRKMELYQIMNRFSEHIFEQSEGEKRKMDRIERLTTYITGLQKNQFEERLKERISAYYVLSSETSNIEIQEQLKELKASLKKLKESYSRAQKEHRLLQVTKMKIESDRLNSVRDPYNRFTGSRRFGSNRSKTDKGGIILKEDLSTAFEMNVLLSDLELYHFHLQDLRLKITDVQEEIDLLSATVRKTSQKDNVKSFSKKRDAKQSEDEKESQKRENWLSYLNFEDFNNPDQKNLFIQNAEMRLYPRNEAIRRQFERAVHGHAFSGNYMKLYSNPDFWKVWYEKRKVHEYARMLHTKYNPNEGDEFNLSITPMLTNTVLNADLLNTNPVLEPIAHQEEIDQYHSIFFFDEDMLPTIDFHRIYSPQSDKTQQASWRDNYYRYVYRQAPIEPKEDKLNVKQDAVILVPTRSEPKLWFQVYQTRVRLLRLTLTSEQTNPTVSLIKKAYDEYVYALCRISHQKGIVSNILSKYLLSRVPDPNRTERRVTEEKDDTRKTEKSRNKVTLPARNQSKQLIQLLQKRRTYYASIKAVVAKYICDCIEKRLKKIANQYRHNRYKFLERTATPDGKKNSSMKYAMIQYTIRSFQHAALCNPDNIFSQIKFYLGLLCTTIRSKLLRSSLDINQFWEELDKQVVSVEWPEIDEPQVEGMKSYKTILLDMIRKEIDSFEFLEVPIDKIDQRTVDKYLSDFSRKSSSSSLINSKQVQKGQISSNNINQYFNTSNDEISISSVLVDETEEQLKSRLSAYVRMLTGGSVSQLHKKHIKLFVKHELKYLINNKHYTMFSGGLFKPSAAQGPRFLPLVEYSKLEIEKRALAEKLEGFTKLDEKLRFMQTEIGHLKSKEEFLDLKLRTNPCSELDGL